MKIRKINAAAALGSLTASVALLAGVNGAHAQGAPGAGSYPGSFLVPGSQTSFSLTGFAQTIYTYDLGVCLGAANGSGPTSGIFPSLDANGVDKLNGHKEFTAGIRNHGCSDFTVATSRFSIQSRTPTAYGELKTFISVDFNGGNRDSGKYNSDRLIPNMREAYGTLGPLLVGQTVSNFRDASIEAEAIDNAGPFSTGRLRTPQVRYTFDFGNGLTLAVAAENAQTKIVNGASSSATTLGGSTVSNPLSNLSDKIPDFTFKLNYSAPWGHVDLRAAFEDLYFHNGSTIKDSTLGWAVGVAGSWNVPFFAGDTLNAAFAYSEGGDKYAGTGAIQESVVLDGHGSIHKIPVWNAQANYAHYWFNSGGANLRTNLIFSYDNYNHKLGNFASGPGSDQRSSFNAQFHYGWWGGVNLIWSPVPQVDLGIEYAYGREVLESGQRGDSSAINATAVFRF